MKLHLPKLSLLISCLVSTSSITAQTSIATKPVKSEWVYYNPKDALSYKTLPQGDRIMDFSHAGYMGGGVSIPTPPVKITLSPIAGDNSDAIQNAINEVSKMKMVDGFRGTVLLNAGIYDCERTLNINASGVVLRGSGSGTNGTIINMTGKAHNCISVRGSLTIKVSSDSTFIIDTYVPAGSNSFRVAKPKLFSVKDTIHVLNP